MIRMLMAAVLCTALMPVHGMTASTPDGLYQQGEAPMAGLGGELNLLTHTGKPFSLQDIQGSPALVFFGFTQCANTCPMAMAQAQQILANFRTRKPPTVLFVTLDPLSDSPAALAQYLAHFDKRIVGLTGSPDQVARAAQRYGVGTQRASTSPNGQLEHSSRWYLLDEKMRLARVYKIDTPASAMAQDIIRAQSHRTAYMWPQGAP